MMVYLFSSSLEGKFALHIKWEWPGDELVPKSKGFQLRDFAKKFFLMIYSSFLI